MATFTGDWISNAIMVPFVEWGNLPNNPVTQGNACCGSCSCRYRREQNSRSTETLPKQDFVVAQSISGLERCSTRNGMEKYYFTCYLVSYYFLIPIHKEGFCIALPSSCTLKRLSPRKTKQFISCLLEDYTDTFHFMIIPR